jgi:hypothetical protein
MLLTHLYEFFGILLGCSMEGGADYSAYGGESSMYEVHKSLSLYYPSRPPITKSMKGSWISLLLRLDTSPLKLPTPLHLSA